jgi:hypothetical protein
MTEVRIAVPKGLEKLVDRIIYGDGVVLPAQKGGGIARKIVSYLQPLRDGGWLLVGRDGKNGKTILKAIGIRVIDKVKRWGRAEYLLDLGRPEEEVVMS